MMYGSDEPGKHSLPPLRIILEILTVPVVFLLRPKQHLTRTGQEKDPRKQRLAADGKCEPAHTLPEVVGAGDEAEAAASGDAAGRGAGGAEVSEGDVAAQVHVLEESESCCQAIGYFVVGPGWGLVLRVEEEVNGEAHEYPVVGTVLEDVEHRHSFV